MVCAFCPCAAEQIATSAIPRNRNCNMRCFAVKNVIFLNLAWNVAQLHIELTRRGAIHVMGPRSDRFTSSPDVLQQTWKNAWLISLKNAACKTLQCQTLPCQTLQGQSQVARATPGELLIRLIRFYHGASLLVL